MHSQNNWSTISYGGALNNNPDNALPPKEFCSKMQTIVDSDYADKLLDQWSKSIQNQSKLPDYRKPYFIPLNSLK